MKRSTKLAATAAVIGLLAFGGSQVLAQGMGGYGYGHGPGMMMGGGYGYGHGPGMMMRGFGTDQQWLDALKTKLALTADQEAAWKTYVTALNDNVQSMIDQHDSMDFSAIQKMTAEEQRSFMQNMHEVRLDAMSAVIDARTALVAVLDDRQKQLFNATGGGYGMMGGGFGHGPGMMWGN